VGRAIVSRSWGRGWWSRVGGEGVGGRGKGSGLSLINPERCLAALSNFLFEIRHAQVPERVLSFVHFGCRNGKLEVESLRRTGTLNLTRVHYFWKSTRSALHLR